MLSRLSLINFSSESITVNTETIAKMPMVIPKSDRNVRSLFALSELKANENFLKLQDELTSTENQILTARTRYNEAIKPYNNHVITFPNNILAGFFNFQEKPYFEAEAGAENAPDVKFDFGKKE